MRGISPLWEQMPLQLGEMEKPRRKDTAGIVSPFASIFETAVARSQGVQPDPITDMFRAAVAAVEETDANKVQMEYLMATGQLDNPALLTTALAKAQLSVDLLVQLRNKATDAYNELMRISL